MKMQSAAGLGTRLEYAASAGGAMKAGCREQRSPDG